MAFNSAAYTFDNQLCRLALQKQKQINMARSSVYRPAIARPLICAVYHEAKRRRVPMTKLVEELLVDALSGTPGWITASEQYPREMPLLRKEV